MGWSRVIPTCAVSALVGEPASFAAKLCEAIDFGSVERVSVTVAGGAVVAVCSPTVLGACEKPVLINRCH